jgi:hypothetical protein
VSSNWNDGANWSLGGVPDAAFGDNAVISTNSPNIATITADISFTPNDINVTGGGRIDHQAGIAGTAGGAWMKIDNGDYNLADTGSVGIGITGFAKGSGSLNATGNLLVAAFGGDRTATMNINTDGTLAVSNELFIGDSQNSTGNFLLESGTMTVNNKIFVGNNRGTGTLTMSGGSLTKTGGDQTFVGRDNGTGTLTQSGGTISLNHDFYVGQGGGGNGTLNVSGSAVLNTGRDFVIGREGGTGSLNVTGGTITKTGDEKMIVGHNNGTGTVVQSGGTINVNQNELYIGNENAGATGTYTLSGSGALNVANELVRYGNAECQRRHDHHLGKRQHVRRASQWNGDFEPDRWNDRGQQRVRCGNAGRQQDRHRHLQSERGHPLGLQLHLHWQGTRRLRHHDHDRWHHDW